jgi:peptide methionine sulfoxide reductase MsrA
MERATFAAGSFERVEETFRRIEGVQQTMVGYAGGSAPDPSYFDVCAGTTGYAEVVERYFDPGQISYEHKVIFRRSYGVHLAFARPRLPWNTLTEPVGLRFWT